MAFDVNGIIVVVTLFVVFGVFFAWDFFREGTYYGFLAYIVAVIPVSTLWFYGLDILSVYVVLFGLWDVLLLRDLLLVYGKNKEYDDILFFLGLGILVWVILCAILPAPQFNPSMQTNTTKMGFFYFPNVYTSSYAIQSWVNKNTLMGFRVAATLMVMLALLPMILDLKESEEDVHPLVVLIITGIFILPFLYLSYIWLPQSIGVLTPLFCVILFIVLLYLTKAD